MLEDGKQHGPTLQGGENMTPRGTLACSSYDRSKSERSEREGLDRLSGVSQRRIWKWRVGCRASVMAARWRGCMVEQAYGGGDIALEQRSPSSPARCGEWVDLSPCESMCKRCERWPRSL